MLKRTIRAAGEAVGVLAPSTPDALAAAELRRTELVQAQSAVQTAEAALEAGYDRGASAKELQELDAKLADARMQADRAQRAYASAERRLAAAREAEADKVEADAIVARDAALDAKLADAMEIDRLAGLIAERVKSYDSHAEVLAEAARHGVASRHVLGVTGHDLARHALEKAGALPSLWLGNKVDQPGAVALNERVAGATLAVA